MQLGGHPIRCFGLDHTRLIPERLSGVRHPGALIPYRVQRHVLGSGLTLGWHLALPLARSLPLVTVLQGIAGPGCIVLRNFILAMQCDK